MLFKSKTKKNYKIPFDLWMSFNVSINTYQLVIFDVHKSDRQMIDRNVQD